jgi:hypothetical protein
MISDCQFIKKQVEEVTASAPSLADMAQTLQAVVTQFNLAEEAQHVETERTNLILQQPGAKGTWQRNSSHDKPMVSVAHKI